MTTALHLSMLHLVPVPLVLLLLSATAAFAQIQTLAINSTLTLNTNNLATSAFALPGSSTDRLSVSVAFCSKASDDGARFYATNDTADRDPGPGGIGSNVFEILIGSRGTGAVTLQNAGSGGWFAVEAGSAEQSFEVGVSDGVGELFTNSVRASHITQPVQSQYME